MIATIATVYVIGVLVSAYLCGRFFYREVAMTALFWPALLVLAAVFGPMLLLGALGQRHRGNSKLVVESTTGVVPGGGAFVRRRP